MDFIFVVCERMIFSLLLSFLANSAPTSRAAKDIFFAEERVQKEGGVQSFSVLPNLPPACKQTSFEATVDAFNGLVCTPVAKEHLIEAVTLKYFNMLSEDPKVRNLFSNEVNFYSNDLKNNLPFVLRCLGYHEDVKEAKIMFEFAKYNTLQTLIDFQKRAHQDSIFSISGVFTAMSPVLYHSPSPAKLRYIAANVVLGLAYLHHQGIVHGKLQPDNIFVPKQLTADNGEKQSRFLQNCRLCIRKGRGSFDQPNTKLSI